MPCIHFSCGNSCKRTVTKDSAIMKSVFNLDTLVQLLFFSLFYIHGCSLCFVLCCLSQHCSFAPSCAFLAMFCSMSSPTLCTCPALLMFSLTTFLCRFSSESKETCRVGEPQTLAMFPTGAHVPKPFDCAPFWRGRSSSPGFWQKTTTRFVLQRAWVVVMFYTQ